MTTPLGRPLPATPFAADDGSADPRIQAALAAFDRGEGGSADVLTALAGGRLLVPVVAVPGDDAEPDVDAVMATVSTTGRDGRRGLLAFTSVHTMRRWDPEARPSPVPTRSAAEAALADGADALVIDLAGPVLFAVDASELRSLAAGWRPVEPWAGVGAADPATPTTDDPDPGAPAR